MTKREMTCCCCGEDAGCWKQHWNRDDGFSICPKCLGWITERERLTRYDSLTRYGRPQVNHGGPT